MWRIFHRTLSVSYNNVMDMNNMMERWPQEEFNYDPIHSSAQFIGNLCKFYVGIMGLQCYDNLHLLRDFASKFQSFMNIMHHNNS